MACRLITNPLINPPATVPMVMAESLAATVMLESPMVILKYRGIEVKSCGQG